MVSEAGDWLFELSITVVKEEGSDSVLSGMFHKVQSIIEFYGRFERLWKESKLVIRFIWTWAIMSMEIK